MNQVIGSVSFPNEKYVLNAGDLRRANYGDFHMPIIEWRVKVGNSFKKLVMLINIDQCIFPFACVGIA